jgi:hypothetical protein
MFSLINVFIGFSVIPVASITRLTCEKAPSGLCVGLQPYPVVPVGSARCTQWEDEPRAVIKEVAQQVVQKRLNPVERREKPMEYLTDLVTTVPEGTSPVKVDELRAAEAVRAPLSSPKRAIWSGSGARRSVQTNGAALGYSAPRYPFISG